MSCFILPYIGIVLYLYKALINVTSSSRNYRIYMCIPEELNIYYLIFPSFYGFLSLTLEDTVLNSMTGKEHKDFL